MKTSEVLRKAKSLIEDPERWCKDAFSVDAFGESVCVTSPEAVQFCAVGAVYRACGREPGPPDVNDGAEDYIEALEAELGAGWLVPDYNDDPNTTHADILALFDRAIAKAEGK